MLNDVLTLDERKTRLVATDHEEMRRCMDLLHKNDKAVIKYFHMGRKDLLNELRQSPSLVDNTITESIAALQKKIDIILSLPPEEEDRDAFGLFYAHWYGYFKHVFFSHEKYLSTCCWIEIEPVLVSVRPYVVKVVKSLSEKSLIHRLNSQIAEGADLDLVDFSKSLSGTALETFLTSYPVLTRLLLEQIEDTVNYLYKVITHFGQDIDRLQSAFGTASRQVSSITLGLGDSHANGETVCWLTIGDCSLIYKPRSNREALFYTALLDLLHEQSGKDCFSVYAPIMVSVDNHCWIEKLENLPCKTESDLALFFQRLGAQVAVIHALNGIDFHYENIIACGSSPVMVDLECLFTAAMTDLRVNLSPGRALFKALKLNSLSVYSSGFVRNSPSATNDFSGLSRQQQFVSKETRLVCEQGYYRVKKVVVESLPTIRHLPVFQKRTHSVAEYKDVFLLAFDQAYDEVMKRRISVVELLEQHAAVLKTRVLFKNTQRYADFLGMMVHPRFTQCKVRHEMLLATLWSDLSESLSDLGIPEHEIKDLERANIPCFMLPLLSTLLVDAHGADVASLAIERPFDSCRRKLESLSSKDKAFQKHILLTCLFPVGTGALPLNREHRIEALPELNHEQYVEHGISIAQVIERWRIEGEEGDVGWTFMDIHPQTRHYLLSPMGCGLYNGMGGLAIFYLSLYRVSGEADYLDQSERILCGISKSHGHFADELTVSAYYGLASYLYVLVNYQLMTGRQTYRATVEGLLHRLSDLPHEGNEFDIIHGWCGAVVVLVNLYQLEQRDTLLRLIEKFSQSIQSALVLENGTLLLKATGKPLWTGLSHGISGVLHAYGKVWEVTKDARLIELITQCLQAENRIMADGFWLDLREAAKSSRTVKWCHGDGGILINRIWLLHALGDTLDADTKSILEQDAARCERHLWEHGLGSGFSLCHGDFGNLMCLLRLYRTTGNAQGIVKVRRSLSGVAANFFSEDFLDEQTVPDLGLMLGISGVGQALLHAVDAGLPDVLSLDFATPTNG